MTTSRMAVLLSGAILLASCSSGRVSPPVVDDVDLSRFSGCWYEIATIPSAVQEGCVATTAEYELNEDGNLDVENTCRLRAFDGTVQRVKGEAWAPEPEHPGKLLVQFDNWWGFFARGDYLIIELDPEYRYALIGGSDAERLWILGRSPDMDDATYEALVDSARGKGYDVRHLVRTPQDIRYVSCEQ